MQPIIVDDGFTSQLPGASAPCPIVDASGNRLGFFTPEANLAAASQVEPSVSEEELDRRELAGGGRSLQAIFADLEKSG